MGNPKNKPLDRYPYMDNNLKNWDNYFVTTEVFSIYVNNTAEVLEDLQDQINEIIIGGDFVPYTVFDPFVEETGEAINTLTYRLDNMTTDFVSTETYNTYTTTTNNRLTTIETNINDIQEQITQFEDTFTTQKEFDTFAEEINGKITSVTPKFVQIRTNATEETTDKPGYPWKQVYTVQGITANHFVTYYEQTGSFYGNPFIIETSQGTITFYGTVKPANSTYFQLYFIEKGV